MKRSKIFLGLTAGVLGVAAFASAKAKFNSNTLYFYTDNRTSHCFGYNTYQPYVTTTAPASPVPAEVTFVGTGSTLYQLYSQSSCAGKLYLTENSGIE
jgi:hypothetical protein